MAAEDDAIHDEQKNSCVAEERQQNEDREDDPCQKSSPFFVLRSPRVVGTENGERTPANDYSRSRIGPIRFSGTRTVPSVCTCFTVP